MHYLILPSDWSVPQFTFNQQVKLKANHEIGVIVGLHYGRQSDALGWYYELELDPDGSAWHCDGIECAHESELEAVVTSPCETEAQPR